jgi:hypothetical protein
MLTIDPSLVVARDREESVVSYVQIFQSLNKLQLRDCDHYLAFAFCSPLCQRVVILLPCRELRTVSTSSHLFLVLLFFFLSLAFSRHHSSAVCIFPSVRRNNEYMKSTPAGGAL